MAEVISIDSARRDRHPKAPALEEYLKSAGPAKVAEHLAGGCVRCALAARQVLRSRKPGFEKLAGRISGRGGWTGRRMSKRVEKARSEARLWASLVGIEAAAAPRLLADLRRLNRREREEWILDYAGLQTMGLTDLLVKRSFAADEGSLEEKIELADLAVQVAHFLDAAGYPRGLVADTNAAAFTALGDAWRWAKNPAKARRAFDQAELWHLQGCGSVRDEATHLWRLGTFYGSQTEFEVAERTLRRAWALAQEVGDDVLVAETWLALAEVVGERGEPGSAAAMMVEAEGVFDRLAGEGLRPWRAAALAQRLAEAGRPREAKAALAEATRQREEERDATRLRERDLRWLEGRIARAGGDLEGAETAWRDVRGACGRAPRDEYGLLVVTVELVSVRLARGDLSGTEELALEAKGLLSSREIHRRAVRGLSRFISLAGARELTAAWAWDFARYLRWARFNPTLRFERLPEEDGVPPRPA